jgi:hypothetical protein
MNSKQKIHNFPSAPALATAAPHGRGIGKGARQPPLGLQAGQANWGLCPQLRFPQTIGAMAEALRGGARGAQPHRQPADLVYGS